VAENPVIGKSIARVSPESSIDLPRDQSQYCIRPNPFFSFIDGAQPMHKASRRLMKLTVFAIFMVVLPVTAAGQQDRQPALTDETGAAIRQLLEQQVAAWNRGDLEQFMATYWNSPQLTFSSGGITTRGWQAALDRYRKKYSSRQAMGRLRFEQIEMQRLADTAVLVLGRWQLTRQEESLQGNFSLILLRFDAGWRIVHDHTSLMESPADDGEEPADRLSASLLKDRNTVLRLVGLPSGRSACQTIFGRELPKPGASWPGTHGDAD
jgi:beta-aspartyl-peptidase (threonine type)